MGRKQHFLDYLGITVHSTPKMRAVHMAVTQIQFALLWYTVSGDFLRCEKSWSFLSHTGLLQPRRGPDAAAFMAPITWQGLKRLRPCKTANFLTMKKPSTARGHQGANNQVPSNGTGRKKHAEGSKGKKVLILCLHESSA